MSGATFTLDDWLAAVRRKPEDLTGYLTAQQWADRLGTWIDPMRRLIRDGLARGMVERRRVPLQDVGLDAIDGARRLTNVYRFLPDKATPGGGG